MKDQILFVSGGETFKDRNQALEYFRNKDIDQNWDGRSWKNWLAWSLEEQYEFIFPQMPMRDNADYEFWKIIFDKYLTKVTSDSPIFIGYSLGTIFFMKYLVENGYSKKIKELHLVAPFVDDKFQPENSVESTGTFAFDISKVKDLTKYADQIHVWHSKDDFVCSFKNAEYIKQEIPTAELHVFENRNHFLQSTFFELFDVLRK